MSVNDGVPSYSELTWHPIEMLQLNHFTESIIMYSLYSSFVIEMLNTWANQNRVIPQDWKGWVSALLESGQQLQWWWWWRPKATK